jgi:lysozyme
MSFFSNLWTAISNFFKSIFGSKPQPTPIPAPIPAPTPQPAPQPLPIPPPAPAPRPSNAKPITVCAGANTLAGLDVSHDESIVDWKSVATSNSFGIVKATECNTYQDPQFAKNWSGMKENGMIRGAYHFLRARDTGADQAKHYLNVVGQLGLEDLPPVLDWEVMDGHDAATNIKVAQDWLDAVEKATGKVPMIYTDPGFWESLNNPIQFARYPLWIANIGTSCPKVQPPWSKWVFWQYSWTGVVPGIGIKCDVDFFNGTLAQLKAFAKDGTLPG